MMSSPENENYEGKDSMSPEKITSHEPTAVKREQEIAEGGQTGTDSEEVKEKYRRQGITKVSGDSNQNTKSSYEGNIDSTSYGEGKGDVREGAKVHLINLR